MYEKFYFNAVNKRVMLAFFSNLNINNYFLNSVRRNRLYRLHIYYYCLTIFDQSSVVKCLGFA